MGEHSKTRKAYDSAFMAVYDAGRWVWSHRRKIASVIIVALPFVSRYITDLPADSIEAFLHLYFGA